MISFVYKLLKRILHFFDVFFRLFGYVLMEFADGFAIGFFLMMVLDVVMGEL